MYSFIFNPRSLYWGLDLFALSCLSPLTFSTGFIDKNNDLLYRHIKEVSTERIQSGSAHYKAYILEELTCVCGTGDAAVEELYNAAVFLV